MSNTSLLTCLAVAILHWMAASPVLAAAGPYVDGRFQGRIAYCCDGNHNDPDDWAASPVTLAILAEAGLKERLVHFDYNCILPLTDPEWEKTHAQSVLGTAERYGFDKRLFFDCQKDRDGAIASIAQAIDNSTAANPLYFVIAGPMEVPYLGIRKSDPAKRQFVYCISHSRWNDGFASRYKFTCTKRSVIEQNVHWVQIRDQNRLLSFGRYGRPAAAEEFEPYFWMRDSGDTKVRWLWERMVVSTRPDPSDAGMTWFLATGDEECDPVKLRRLIDEHRCPAPMTARPQVRIEAENFRHLEGCALDDRNDKKASHALSTRLAGGNTGSIRTRFDEPFTRDGASYDVEIRHFDAKDSRCRLTLSVNGAAQGAAWESPGEGRGWMSWTIREVTIRRGDEIRVDVRGDDAEAGKLDYVQLNLCFGSAPCLAQEPRPRVIIETDAGGDPDDEQSLVRFLVYANEFDIEGIIANRPVARDRENQNPIRDGLGIVRAQVNAYGQCYANLVQHDPRFPKPDQLLACTVAGYDDTGDGVNLILRAVDGRDPRPVWFCNWGTDHGSAASCLKRALDRVLRDRGRDGYARFKSRLRLSSYDAFGEHTTTLKPPFPLWVDTFRPPLDGKRWYHRFSALTATAGGFDIERDVRADHGPLGALYPTNTGLRQKEGDTMAFLYLVPTGMNDPQEPTWGSWAGRYGPNEEYPGKPYFWANQKDAWRGTTSRDNTLARWAADLQNDFRARMDWCVKPRGETNHRPSAVLNGRAGWDVQRLEVKPGKVVELDAHGSSDPDEDALTYEWFVYGEAGTYGREIPLTATGGPTTRFTAPEVRQTETIHVILRLKDNGEPPLCAYRRAVVTVRP